MNTKPLRVALVALTLWFGPSGTGHAQGAADEAQVSAVAAGWETAWNNHDMKALATLFTDDADFVNVGARHWKGRAQIEKEHAARLNQFVDSVWSTSRVAAQFLTPEQLEAARNYFHNQAEVLRAHEKMMPPGK